MEFDFIKDPKWLELDKSTKDKVIAQSFLEEIATDPQWKTLPEETKSSVFDQYFKEAYDAESALPAPSRTILGTAGDVLVSGAKGVVGLGESVVGMADIPTMGRAGGLLEEKLGYDPKTTQSFLEDLYSDAQKHANDRVARAEGFIGTTKEMLLNPSTIGHSVIESAPSMLGGAAVGRGLLAAAPKVPAAISAATSSLLKKGAITSEMVAAAFGEGAISAGSSAEQMRQDTEDGLLTAKQAAIAIGSGAGTSAFTLVGGRLAKKMGLEDVDSLLVGGKSTAKTGVGVAKRIAGGGISEGIFEELPQSIQEQVWLNAALDKPLFEGVPEAGATGMLTGFAMGAGANIRGGKSVAEDIDAGIPEIDAAETADEAIAAFEEAVRTPSSAEEAARVFMGDDVVDDALMRNTMDRLGIPLPSLAGKSPEDMIEALNKAQAEQIVRDFTGRPRTFIDKNALDPIQLQRENDKLTGRGILSSVEDQIEDARKAKEKNRGRLTPLAERAAEAQRVLREAETRGITIPYPERQALQATIDEQKKADDVEPQELEEVGRFTEPVAEDGDGIRRARDKEYGIDVEMSKDGEGGYVITTSDPTDKDKKISSGFGGIYLGEDILNSEGEFVAPSQIVQGGPGTTPAENRPFKPKASEKQTVVDLVAEIEFNRSTGNMDEVGRLEKQLLDICASGTNVETATKEAATSPENDLPEPTDAQKKAGNYKKAHFTLHGMPIAIENPRDSKRAGTDENGNPWSVTMKHHYGYFNRTEGRDGDQIDVIVGPDIASQKAFVVDQTNPETGEFDEHKTLIGFKSKAEAEAGYLANYEKGWKGMGEITEMPMAEFKEWIGDGKRKTEPVAYKAPPTPERTNVAPEGVARKPFDPMGILTGKVKSKPETEESTASPEIDSVVSTIRAEIEDWASREYKDGKKVVSSGGKMDDLNSTLTTTGAANERRRQSNISIREKAILELESAKERIANGEDASAVYSELLDSGSTHVVDFAEAQLKTTLPAPKRTDVAPEGPDLYFKDSPDAKVIPLSDITPSEKNLKPSKVDRGRKFMNDVEAGNGEPRAPLTVFKRNDGKLILVDGNTTYSILKERGQTSAKVVVINKLKQPFNTLDKIYEKAEEANPELQKISNEVAEKYGAKVYTRPGDQLKNKDRALQKINTDYDGDASLLKDVIGTTISFKTEAEMFKAMKDFDKEYDALDIKDRFNNPLASGYRDILMLVRMGNGLIAEIQFTKDRLFEAKEEVGHGLYQIWRDLYSQEEKTDSVLIALRDMLEIQKDYYNGVYERDAASSIALFDVITSENKAIFEALSTSDISTRLSPSSLETLKVLSSTTKGTPPSDSRKDSDIKSPPFDTKINQNDKKVKPFMPGSDQKLTVPGNKTVPVTFGIMERSDVLPSHDPIRFFKSTGYPDNVQERQYHTDKEEQLKVIDHEQNLRTNLVLNNNPDAINGPPIVTPDGIVLGGNSRAMSISRAYINDEKHGKGSKYKTKLKQFSDQFGLTAEDINSMDEPILVRMYSPEDTSSKNLHRLATTFNAPLTQAMSDEAKTASMGKNVSIETIEKIGDTLANRELTLREFLGKTDAVSILSDLVNDGAIAKTDENALVNRKLGLLNESGKKLVEQTVFGAIIDDPDLLSTAQRSLKNKIGYILSSLATIKARGGEWDITGKLKDAFGAVVEMNGSGFTNVNEYLAQQSLFGEGKISDPETIAIAKALIESKLTVLRQNFKGYARDASADTKNQKFLFEPKTQSESFAEWFGLDKPIVKKTKASDIKASDMKGMSEADIDSVLDDVFGENKEPVEPKKGKRKEKKITRESFTRGLEKIGMARGPDGETYKIQQRGEGQYETYYVETIKDGIRTTDGPGYPAQWTMGEARDKAINMAFGPEAPAKAPKTKKPDDIYGRYAKSVRTNNIKKAIAGGTIPELWDNSNKETRAEILSSTILKDQTDRISQIGWENLSDNDREIIVNEQEPAKKYAHGYELNIGDVVRYNDYGDIYNTGTVISKDDTYVKIELESGSTDNKLLDTAFEVTEAAAVKSPAKKAQKPTVKGLAKKASLESLEAVQEGIKGLTALFSPKNTLGMGPVFDEDTYAAAKVHFEKMLDAALAAEHTIGQLAKHILDSTGDYIRPYLRRFMIDKSRENTDIKEKGGPNDTTTADRPSEEEQTGDLPGTGEGRGSGEVPGLNDKSGNGSQTNDDRRGDVKRPGERIDAPRDFRPVDYRISKKDSLGAGGKKSKFADNIAAIKLIKELEESNGVPTVEEQAVLVKYVGWGGIPEAFTRPDGSISKGWENEAKELQDIFTKEEYAAAKRSTQDAHYTSESITKTIYKGLSRLGFNGGRILEPAVGTGNFLGLIPMKMKHRSNFVGVELDPTTATIAKYLYPQQRIHQSGFEEFTTAENSFDLAIGNPPFGNQKVFDPNNKAISKFSIHNFFFAKSIKSVRPGGLLSMVVSSSMMDKRGGAQREWIANRTELLAAIRLPNNAFAKNANTQVTTDIIFLRKLNEGESATGNSWSGLRQVTGPDGIKYNINEYFADNPDMMLGDLGHNKLNPRGADEIIKDGVYTAVPGMIPRKGLNINSALSDAIDALPSNIYKKGKRANEVEKSDILVSAPGFTRVYGYAISDDGRAVRRLPDQNGEQVYEDILYGGKPLAGARLERMKGMLGVRDALRTLIRSEISDMSPGTLEMLRRALNKKYDKFVAKYGYISDQGNSVIMRGDPTDYPLLRSLEANYQKPISPAVAKKKGIKPSPSTADKATIFSERIRQPYREVTKTENASEALMVVLREDGAISMERLMDLSGKTEAEVSEELSGVIFLNPITDQWETKDSYLSGNVKEKLQHAKNSGPRYQANVKALEEVQPEKVEAADISVGLGASWVPASVFEGFARDVLQLSDVSVIHHETTGRWSVDASGRGAESFGTEHITANNLFKKMITGRDVAIYEKDDNGNRYLNKEATTIANAKIDEINRAFTDWVLENESHAGAIEEAFNEKVNVNVEATYDGSHMIFPGMGIITAGVKRDDQLRPHQKDVAWRMIQKGKALLDHVVGSGKTYPSIAAGLEMKRMGLVNKPMYVVPNHLVSQWATDFQIVYPGANVLVINKSDFTAKKRQEFMGRIATGNWDAVLIAHSSFGFIPTPVEYERRFISEQMSDYDEALTTMREAEGKTSRSVKNAEKARDRLGEKLLALNSVDRDNVVDFEDIGVDALFVDEAHEFKNLFYATSHTRVAGLGNPQGSQKAFNLFVKTRFLQEKNNGKGVFFLTGTPVSNTIAEMYTMMRYLDYDRLQSMGIKHFDQWASMFADITTDWEVDPSGTRYRQQSKFRNFKNLPGMMGIYKDFADIVSQQKLIDRAKAAGTVWPIPDVKGGKPEQVVVEGSELQKNFMSWIVNRMDNMPEDPREDNPLKATGEAMKASLDLRIINPSVPDDPNSKVNTAIGRIYDIYTKWYDRGGTQLVFCDLSVPKNAKSALKKEIDGLRADLAAAEAAIENATDDQKIADLEEKYEKISKKFEKFSYAEMISVDSDFSVYDDIKEKLINMGVPENEIAFIHDANTDLQKKDLFERVDSAKVRILLGSTSKMGAGMNVQRHLVALHHLDAPWRPSDLEQREGRIIRQGNKFFTEALAAGEKFEVEILRYATKESLDTRRWQVIEDKARVIQQIRNDQGFAWGETVEDSTRSEANDAAEMKAAASGNPLFLEEMQLREEDKKIRALRRSFLRTQLGAKRAVTRKAEWDREYDGMVEDIERDAANIEPNYNRDPDKWNISINDKEYRADVVPIPIEKTAADFKRDEFVPIPDELSEDELDGLTKKQAVAAVKKRGKEIKDAEKENEKEIRAAIRDSKKAISDAKEKNDMALKFAKSAFFTDFVRSVKQEDGGTIKYRGIPFELYSHKSWFQLFPNPISKLAGQRMANISYELNDLSLTGLFATMNNRVNFFDEEALKTAIESESKYVNDAAKQSQKILDKKFEHDDRQAEITARLAVVMQELQSEGNINANAPQDFSFWTGGPQEAGPQYSLIKDWFGKFSFAKKYGVGRAGNKEIGYWYSFPKDYSGPMEHLATIPIKDNGVEILHAEYDGRSAQIDMLGKLLGVSITDKNIVFRVHSPKDLQTLSGRNAADPKGILRFMDMSWDEPHKADSLIPLSISAYRVDLGKTTDYTLMKGNEEAGTVQEGQLPLHVRKVLKKYYTSMAETDNEFGDVYKDNLRRLNDKMQIGGTSWYHAMSDYERQTPFTFDNVKDAFKGQEVVQNKDGTIWVKTKGGNGVIIDFASSIKVDVARVNVTYGKMKTESIFALGKYNKGVITLDKKYGRPLTLAHESYHWMEDISVITPVESEIIKAHIRKLSRDGKFEYKRKDDIGGTEDRATFVSEWLDSRRTVAGALGRVLKAIGDFVDGLVNLLGIRTARGVVRDIESGKIYSREGHLLSETGPSYQASKMKNPSYEELKPEDIPKKTQKVYKLMKLFVRRPGELFPLYARPDKGPAQSFTVGKWFKAEKQTPSGLADRPGIHAVDLPIFSQGKAKAKGETRVWVEVLMPEFDADTQSESDETPLLPNGQRTGIRDRLIGPKEAYNYRTNPNAAGGAGAWPIAGSMRAVRVLSDAEVENILKDAGETKHIKNSMAGTAETTARQINEISKTKALYSLSKKENPAVIDRIFASEDTLRDRIDEFINSGKSKEGRKLAKDRVIANTLDKLHFIKQRLGDRAYKIHRMLTGVKAATFAMFLEHGKLSIVGDTFTTNEKNNGVLPFLKSIGPDWKNLLYYVTAKRAEMLDAQGRENLITKKDRDEIFKMVGDRSKAGVKWSDLNKKLQEFNNNILDIAVQAGLINKEGRELWQHDFYIPFYRVFENEATKEDFLSGPKRSHKHITAQIRRLKGGESKLGNPVENLLKNWMYMLDAAARNKARGIAYDAGKDIGIIEDVSKKDLINILGTKKEVSWAGHIIKRDGSIGKRASFIADTEAGAEEIAKGMRGNYKIQKRVETSIKFGSMKDLGVMSFQRDGKPVYFKTEDQDLYESLNEINTDAFNGAIMRMMGKAKRTLSYTATWGAAFKIRNMIRDTVHVSIINKDFKPFIDSAIGFMKSMREDPEYIEYMASGFGFGSSYVDSSDPKSGARFVERIIKSEGREAGNRILDTGRKVLGVWEKIGAASENAARVALFSNLKKKGYSNMDAGFEARDLMDFSMSGGGSTTQLLIRTIPFLNARVQAFYKLGRAAKQDPKTFAARSAMLTVASLALWAIFKDDDRYKELEPWDKWTYYHFWVGDEQYRIPKPFEVGAVFSSLPETIANVQNGTDEGKEVWDWFKFTARDILSLDMPQLFKPLVEESFNTNTFTGRRIVPDYMTKLKASEQYHPWTSETARMIGDFLNVSPLRIQHIVRGYFSTIGLGVLSGLDIFSQEIMGYPEGPATTIDDYGLGFIKRGAPARSTKYISDFYNMLKEIDSLNRTVNHFRRTGEYQEIADIMKSERNRKLLSLKTRYNKVNRKIRSYNERIKQVYQSSMTPSKKRALIDKLTNQKNDLVKQLQ